ncbi:MAG: sugar phosphate isomerase/epimerase [Gammaproteobacteria bacterium]|nr:sugar phosphate isomerase/epimerase [Gammaproteobacteria bacterium]
MAMEIDLFWVTKAGFNPLDYIAKYPGRFEQCHVKDMDADGTMVDVGKGEIDFKAIFAISKQAGFQHYYVEHDRPANSLVSAKNSIDYLKHLSF